MVTEIEHGIYTFEVVLPENPLKWLNSYVIPGGPGERNLLIDSGFRRPECQQALLSGMRELNLDPEQTDVFFTHLHSDHTGNGDMLQEMGCRLLMGSVDYQVLLDSRSSGTWQRRMERMGMPSDEMDVISSRNPAIIFAPKSFTAETVEDGDVLRYGGRELECVFTPGHTPGHMCLYDRANKLMFTGDHVLFDITPNIVSWNGYPDSLGTYLNSLERIRAYEVRTALPAHRTTGGKTMQERIDELRAHHEARLNEALYVVTNAPGACAYELAGEMTWRIRARNWDEFPPSQKWFAVGECMAHLEHLAALGLVRIEQGQGPVLHYYPV